MQHIKIPSGAKEQQGVGRIFASFSVDENGDISNIRIMRSFNENMNAEVIRVIKTMPRWIPAQRNGTTISSTYILPFTICLE